VVDRRQDEFATHSATPHNPHHTKTVKRKYAPPFLQRENGKKKGLIYYIFIPIFQIIPHGLVVRIRASHARGRGSIPRGGGLFFSFFSFFLSFLSFFLCVVVSNSSS
jgi:hypothetical protein